MMNINDDAEIFLSAVIVVMSGPLGLLLIVMSIASGNILLGISGLVLFCVSICGWWRAFGGNLLWRDRD